MRICADLPEWTDVATWGPGQYLGAFGVVLVLGVIGWSRGGRS